MKNLTSGNIRSQLMFLALPLIAGNMLQQFYHTIDALVIGRFAGPAAFAAIGVSGTVMNLFIFVINGFCTGISIILAQFYGRGDQRGFCREFFTSLASGCVFTAAISILGIMSLSGVLQMIGTPAEVAAPAQAYLVIIFCGLMTTFLYNFCSAVLRAAGDTRAALFFLAAAVCANLALDLVFVALLHRGVAGAGWATILSQGISVLLCLLYMKQKAPVLLLHRDDMVLEPFLLKRTWRCCSVTALHQSSVYIGKLLVQGTVNSLGTGTIAAFTAASRIEGFANSFGDSGCASVGGFVGQQGRGPEHGHWLQPPGQGGIPGRNPPAPASRPPVLLCHVCDRPGCHVLLAGRRKRRCLFPGNAVSENHIGLLCIMLYRKRPCWVF